MDCTECEENQGEMADVEFKDGTVTTVPLCDVCREEFSEGDLVQAVDVEGE